jgi:hypothetical protein
MDEYVVQVVEDETGKVVYQSKPTYRRRGGEDRGRAGDQPQLGAIRDAHRLGLGDFVAVHASPPCQRWADAFVLYRDDHPDLIGPIRERLIATGLPYVIENVKRAPLREPVMICAGGLGCVAGELQLHRHRIFESNVPLMGVQSVDRGEARGDGHRLDDSSRAFRGHPPRP